MKQTWQRISSKIDGLGLRERILVFLMGVVVLVALVKATVLDQRFSKESELSRQIAQDQSQIAGIQTEIQTRARSYNPNPDAVKQLRLEQLNNKSQQMRASLQDMQKGLVSPDRMTALLEDILKQNGKLHLASLRTLPASALVEPEPDNGGAGKGPTENKPADSPAKKAHSSTDAQNPSADTVATVVYKHGVEIVIEGEYVEMVNYMEALEKMPWQLFWGKAKLTVDEHSRLNLTLTLYTLSLDKKWLSI